MMLFSSLCISVYLLVCVLLDKKVIMLCFCCRHQIKMIRCTLGQLHDVATLDTDGSLVVYVMCRV